MSDPEYQSTKFWFMPASKALDVAEAPPPPGKITITHEFPITRSVMFFSWGPASLHPRHSPHRQRREQDFAKVCKHIAPKP